MRIPIIIYLWIFCISLLADEFNPFAGPKPLVVLTSSDPWNMAMESDAPDMVVYEDGSMIFLIRTNQSWNYYHKQLSPTELTAFKKRLQPVLKSKDLQPFYDLAPGWSHQPHNYLYVQNEDRVITTHTHGLMSKKLITPTSKRKDGREPDILLGELTELHEFLTTSAHPDSRLWQPKYIEVRLWPDEEALGKSIKWPKSWPQLDSKRTMKRGAANSYSIFLDASLEPELKKFLKRRNPKDAVEIGKQKWRVTYRYTFPNELLWLKVFKNLPRNN